ncbi:MULTISPECIES: uroporphyrinogen-III synthase [Comamonas]|jgi:uroporphyrinogen-III synthase|uniref:uroporphyrinogen-III synthase n=1 Tax=Comamonas TaxID=283 RepID=UPI0012C30C98|nr:MULTISPECIES: uroporphyrinogen-III synthase [Comamonas]MDR3064252.1 uroporphyrinogen-III synthase [Comamonas sp.]MEB5964017.1 uroporphyrinogen-III synthase [Comamonas testosteroni]MPS95072.1 uroporphyrinogen-III synthase [Comamonas sp.]
MRRVLVTRPLHDANPWVEAFRARGLQAEALPLIGIGPCSDPAAHQALGSARQLALQPGHYRAVMFVSGNAAQYFFHPDPPRKNADPALLAPDTRAWTPGPGTERALRALGLPSRQIDGPCPDAAQFESEALWRNVQGQVRPGDRVLIVRGASPASAAAGTPVPSTQGAGRDWLAARLREAGAEVELLAVYERQLPHWTAQQLDIARQAASDGSLWLFSSSEAVANLQQLLPQQQWHSGLALTTHERIASKALSAGFGRVLHSRPSLDDVVASIESVP